MRTYLFAIVGPVQPCLPTSCGVPLNRSRCYNGLLAWNTKPPIHATTLLVLASLWCLSGFLVFAPTFRIYVEVPVHVWHFVGSLEGCHRVLILDKRYCWVSGF